MFMIWNARWNNSNHKETDVFTLSIKNNATATLAQISYCAVDFAGS